MHIVKRSICNFNNWYTIFFKSIEEQQWFLPLKNLSNYSFFFLPFLFSQYIYRNFTRISFQSTNLKSPSNPSNFLHDNNPLSKISIISSSSFLRKRKKKKEYYTGACTSRFRCRASPPDVIAREAVSWSGRLFPLVRGYRNECAKPRHSRLTGFLEREERPPKRPPRALPPPAARSTDAVGGSYGGTDDQLGER